jgi:hypothetical protein
MRILAMLKSSFLTATACHLLLSLGHEFARTSQAIIHSALQYKKLTDLSIYLMRLFDQRRSILLFHYIINPVRHESVDKLILTLKRLEKNPLSYKRIKRGLDR